MREAVARRPGLEVSGAAYQGVGIPGLSPAMDAAALRTHLRTLHPSANDRYDDDCASWSAQDQGDQRLDPGELLGLAPLAGGAAIGRRTPAQVHALARLLRQGRDSRLL